VVAHEPPPVPLDDPQADPAIERAPTLSTWTHLVPDPPKLETIAVFVVKSVITPVAAKKFVVVAFVVVECVAVNLWSVEDPVSNRFESVVSPAVAVRVPVKLAADEMVWPFMRPEVIGPTVSCPSVARFARISVVEAMPET
jgi:hypothetical protein